MGENSAIEWTDHTFNPWWGCTKVSPGCDNCYAEAFANRLMPASHLWDANRRTFGAAHWAGPIKWDRKAEKEGKRARVFCASMADVFDKDGPTGARADLWDLIEDTPHLDWLLLTKRVGNVLKMIPPHWNGILKRNIWLGISVVNQVEADRDIPKLIEIPAYVRFLSCEPLLGPITFEGRWVDHADPALHENWLEVLSWVIVGGESGPNSRPMSPIWARSLRDQCAAIGTAFFFKQWGEWAPSSELGFHGHERARTQVIHPHVLMRVGKKIAGRTLDGFTHSEWPHAHTSREPQP